MKFLSIFYCFSVPHPSSLYGDEDEELPIFQATACVILSLAKVSEVPNSLQCTACSWHQGKDHVYIAGGFSNGEISFYLVFIHEVEVT